MAIKLRGGEPEIWPFWKPKDAADIPKGWVARYLRRKYLDWADSIIWGILKPNWLIYTVIMFATTFIVMIISGRITQAVIRHGKPADAASEAAMEIGTDVDSYEISGEPAEEKTNDIGNVTEAPAGSVASDPREEGGSES